MIYARRNKPGEKAWPKLAETFAEKLKPILETWLDQTKRNPQKMDFAKWNRLLTKSLIENLETNFRDLSEFDTKLFEPKPWADFWESKTWKTSTAKNADFCEPETLLKTKTLICKTQNANLKTNLIWKSQPKDLLQVLANGKC